MLSERQLEALLKVFEARTQAVTEQYLTLMGEHLRDIGQLSDTDVHRLIQLKRMNANIETIKREIARAAGVMLEDVEEVFRQVAADDERFAREIFESDHTPTVKFKPGSGALSTPVERVLKAQLRITAQEMANLSQTTIDSTLYREAVDVAVQTVQTGMTDYTSAIRSAMKRAAAEGLKVVYPSGYSRRLDTAVRQNILDGVRSINQDVFDQLGKDFGADGVEISAHELCATDHLPYQGRQYSKRDFERIQNTLDRPFGMWNCKHTMYPIILGVSEPAHTEEELAQFARNSNAGITIDDVTMSRYEWSQQQRRLETRIRAQKDIAVAAKASGDMPARREAQRNINALQEQYTRISKAAGLDERPDKMTVAGFRKVKTAEELKRSVLSEDNADVFRRKSSPGNSDLLSGAKTPRSLEKVVKERYNKGNPNAKSVYDNYIPQGGAVASGTYKATPHFSPVDNAVYMNFDADAINPRGACTTWFHEHGHYVDYNTGKPSMRPSYAQALDADRKALEKAFRKKIGTSSINDVRQAIVKELVSVGDKSSGIQDILGGTIGRPYTIDCWGHSPAYWKSKGPVGVCSESFAHMFEASFDEDKQQLMQIYLPSAWAEFQKILEELT